MDNFKKFLARGNIVDLSIGIMIGAAFSNVVNSFVQGILVPLTGEELRIPDFSHFKLTIAGEVFAFGDFVDALISLLLVVVAIYFLIVVPINRLNDWHKQKELLEHPKKKCAECLSEIPIDAKRCSHCAEPQPATTGSS